MNGFTWLFFVIYDIIPEDDSILRIRRCVGTGRRDGLKIRWWQHRVGSSPTTGTIRKRPGIPLRKSGALRFHGEFDMKKVRELSCSEAQKLVQPYINGKLSDSECEAFLAHVRSCPDCYDELETYFIIFYSLKYLDDDSKNTSYDLRKILNDQIRRNEATIRAGKLVVRFSNVLLIISETLIAFTAILRMKPALLIYLRYWLYQFYLFLMS